MDKMIKVSEETHKGLKIGASLCGMSMKKFLSSLAKNNKDGIPVDVESYSTDTLIPLFLEIVVLFDSRKPMMKEEESSLIKMASSSLCSAFSEIKELRNDKL